MRLLSIYFLQLSLKYIHANKYSYPNFSNKQNMKLFKLIPLITIFFLISCRESEETWAAKQKMKEEMAEKEEERQFQMVRLERNKLENTIYKKFGASITFDTAKFGTTYQYQTLLKQNGLVAVDNFEITDIEQKDSNYIISIEVGYNRKKIIEIICNKHELDKIYPNILTSDIFDLDIDDKYLILKIKSVKKVKFKLDNNDEPNSEIELVTPTTFFCKGDFIDIYSKPKIK